MSNNETPEKSDSDSESKSETLIKEEEEPSKQLIKNDSQLNINNYTYENKDIEALCDKFIENLFLVNPKNYDSFQSHLKIRKISSDTSRSNLQNSQKKLNLSNNKLNINNSNYNSNSINNEKKEQNSKKDNNESNNNIQSNSSLENKLKKESVNTRSRELENNASLVGSKANSKRVVNNSNSSSGRIASICNNFVEDLFYPKNNSFIQTEHGGDELNIVERSSKTNNLEILNKKN